MGAEVLLTGTDYDLDPNDVLVDDNAEPRTAMQNLEWILRTFRGEYADDVAVGVDYLRHFATKTPTQAIVDDILANAKRIETLSNVTLTVSSRLGRDVTLAFKARFNADVIAGGVLVSPDLPEQLGGQSPIAPYLTLRRA